MNDKTQRIVAMSIREDRLTRIIRFFYHSPTSNMLADGLTKVGVFPQLLTYATTGLLKIHLKESQYIRIRESPKRPAKSVTEEDIVDIRQ